jgi:hypothetical protein
VLTKVGNTIYENCRQNKGSLAIYKDDEILVTKQTVTKPKERKLNIGNKQLDYDLLFPPDKNVYFIKAEMKMGKTKKCIEYIEQSKPETIVLISFRRTFSSEMKSKYVGFELYSDIKESRIDLLEHPKIIVQVESIHRVAVSTVNLVILDEVESIWNQFSSGNLVDYYGVINTFTYLIRHSTKIVVMDANLSKRSTRLIQYLRPDFEKEINLYINNYNPSYDYKYLFVDKSLFYLLIGKHLAEGSKIVIMTNSIKETNQLSQYIAEQFKSIKMIVYNSKTIQSKKTKHFSNVNVYWKKYDCVIYSPTVSAGVSFEVEHFNYVFASFTSMSCNVETCRQMLGRVRNIGKKTIYLNIKSAKSVEDKYPTTPDNVKYHLRYHRQKLVKNASAAGLLNFEYMQNGQAEYYDNFAYQLVAENIAFDNKSKNDFCKRLLYYFDQTGTDYKFIDSESYTIFGFTKADITKIKLKIENNKININKHMIESILEAETIDQTKYNELRNKINKCQDVSQEESKAMDKFKINNTLGVEADAILVDIFMNNHNLKIFNMTKSLLSNETTRNDINKMRRHLMSGADLGDATAKYNSVIHYLVKKIFAIIIHPSITIVDMFTSGCRFLRETTDDVDVKKLRGCLGKLLNCLNLPIPTKLNEFDRGEIFTRFINTMNKIYWIEINPPSCKTKNGVAFQYKDKLYTDAEEVKSTKLPIILIECD